MHKSRKSIDKQQEAQMKTAKQIFAKSEKTAEELAEGIDILYSGQKTINEDVRVLIKKEIIDYTKREVKKRDEQWIAILEEIGYYNIQRLIELLPEPEFE